MLVAPLMKPILASSAAVVSGWPKRQAGYPGLVAAASSGTILVAWALASLLPVVGTTLPPGAGPRADQPNGPRPRGGLGGECCVAAGAIPAVAILIGALIMFAYPLTEDVFRRIVGETAARRAGRRADAAAGAAAGEAT